MVATTVKASKVSRRLVIVWSVTTLLIGMIIALEMLDRGSEDDTHGADSSDRSRMLLPASIDQLDAIEVLHESAIHRFERDASRAWFYHGAHVVAEATHAHPPDPVRSKRIDEAFQGLDRARIERTLAIDMGVQQFGLTVPRMLIVVYGQAKPHPLLQIAVGDIAPDAVSRYVLPVGAKSVITIANFQIDNLVALIKSMNEPASGAPVSKVP